MSASQLSWNAGDGYQVTDDYLKLPDYFNLQDTSGLKSNYYGGEDDVSQSYRSLIQPGGLANPTPDYGSGGNTLGQTISGATSALGAGSTLGAVGNGIGTVVGSYNNASEDTGSSVLSGAASGAAAGAAFGPWGAVIGGVIGGLAGFFGSKSKKAAAKKAFNQQVDLQTAGLRQEQANYLQKQQMTQAAIQPYKGSYEPGGYHFKNAIFGGDRSNMPQPTQGSFMLPSGPPSLTSNGTKITGANIPQASFNPTMTLPSTTIKPPAAITPQLPQYSGNKAKDQASINGYASQLAQKYYQDNQNAAAAAYGPYSAFFNQGA